MKRHGRRAGGNLGVPSNPLLREEGAERCRMPPAGSLRVSPNDSFMCELGTLQTIHVYNRGASGASGDEVLNW